MTYTYRVSSKTVPETLYSKTYEKEMTTNHSVVEILREGVILFRLYSEHGEVVSKGIAEDIVKNLNNGSLRLSMTLC